jgi:hypothetical protein
MNTRDYPTLHLDINKVKEQLVVRKDVDVNKHERLSNITLRHKLSKGTACSKKGYGCK